VLVPQKHRIAQTRDILESKAISLKQAIGDETALMSMSPEEKHSMLDDLRAKHAQN
jgi:hypothetical protein